jgi:hypothetical protein
VSVNRTGSYVERIGDVVVRYDGVHFFGDGKRVLWQWLGPRLDVPALAAQRGRPRGPA